MIDRPEHDEQMERATAKTPKAEDIHADHSLDPDEHYGQESDVPRADAEANEAARRDP